MKTFLRGLKSTFVLGVAAGALAVSLVIPAAAQLFSSIQVGSGSFFKPSITFLADNNKGIYDNGTNSVGVAVNQLPGFTVSQSTAQDVEVAVRNHLVTNRLGDVAPTVSGQGASTILGNDFAGRITVGTGGTGAITVTFAKAYLVAPSCQFNDEVTVAANPGKALGSKTTVVWTPSGTGTVTADTVTYTCIGNG